MLNQTRKIPPYFKKALSPQNKPYFFHSSSPYTWVVQIDCIELIWTQLVLNLLSLLFSPVLLTGCCLHSLSSSQGYKQIPPLSKAALNFSQF